MFEWLCIFWECWQALSAEAVASAANKGIALSRQGHPEALLALTVTLVGSRQMNELLCERGRKIPS